MAPRGRIEKVNRVMMANRVNGRFWEREEMKLLPAQELVVKTSLKKEKHSF